MSEAITGLLGAAVMLIVAVIRERSLKRQKGKRLDAEAVKLEAEGELAEATALQTVGETYKGLLVVIQNQLDQAIAESKRTTADAKRTREEFEHTREELERTQQEVRQLRSDLDTEKQRTQELTDEVARLTERLSAAEQENP